MGKMKNVFYIFLLDVILLLLFICNQAEAMTEGGGRIFSLDDCMSYAVRHNTDINKRKYTNDDYRINKKAAVAALLPSASLSVTAGSSYGRTIDPSTNTYSNTGHFSNEYSASSSMPLFCGFRHINGIRAARYMCLSGEAVLQKVKDETAIAVMQAYFDVVYYSKSAVIAGRQLGTSQKLLFKSKKQFDLGIASRADVAQMQSQVAAGELLLVQQENFRDLALLHLKEKMNYPQDDTLVVDTLYAADLRTKKVSVYAILDYAMKNNPGILAAGYAVENERMNLRVAKGGMAPSLYLYGGYSTNYYKNLNDGKIHLPFKTQFREHRRYYWEFSLSIPLFGGLSYRKNAVQARNSLKISMQERMRTRQELNTEVRRAIMERNGYAEEYMSALKKEESAREAFELAAGQFEKGLVSSIDLRTASDNLLKAGADRLKAELQYAERCRLVSYYGGTPLVK
ncbi:MAG: TolC family protein [Bacteroidales bacterium]|jgi:outer membrane protein|nr:TolC family protein [Bacteroidales bacterium]